MNKYLSGVAVKVLRLLERRILALSFSGCGAVRFEYIKDHLTQPCFIKIKIVRLQLFQPHRAIIRSWYRTTESKRYKHRGMPYGILYIHIWYQLNGINSENFNIKFFARQANTIYKYKNLEVKLINYNANIYFNRQCLNKHIIPNYAKHIKIPHTSPAALHTERKAQIQRIKVYPVWHTPMLVSNTFSSSIPWPDDGPVMLKQL
jgi:hypothetical protein